MVGDFIICLLAFFNIFIYLFIYFYLKKEGSRKEFRRGPKKGSKKGGPEGRVHALSTSEETYFYQNSKHQEYYGENLSKHVQLSRLF